MTQPLSERESADRGGPQPPERPLFVDVMPAGGWPKGHMFLTWFGLGLINRGPGTLASAGSLPLAALIVWMAGPLALLGAAAAIFALGYFLVSLHLRADPELKDPQWIVIDEVAGQWATLAVVPLSLGWYLLGFALFRVFDILKPWPVSWADRRPGAFGVMADDALAAGYAAIVLWAAYSLWTQAV